MPPRRPDTSPIRPDISDSFSSISLLAWDILENPDYALRQQPELAHQMERDPALMAAFEKRILATAQLDFQVRPEDDRDEKQVQMSDEIESIIRRIPNTQDLYKTLLWAVWRGRNAAALNWFYSDARARWEITRHEPMHGDKFNFTRTGQPRILTRDTQPGGREFTQAEKDGLILHVVDPDDGRFYDGREAGYAYNGRGLRDKIFNYWWLSHNILRLWLTFLERFGGGLVLGKYPMGNDNAKEAMKSILKNMLSDTKIAVPTPKDPEEREAFSVETVDIGTGTSQSQNFQDFIEYLHKHMNMLIQGQTLTSEAGSTGLGSNLASVHENTFFMFRDYDATALEQTLTNQLVRRLVEFNYGTQPFELRFSFVKEVAQYQERERQAKLAQDLGMQVKRDWLYETTNIPVPTEEDKVVDFGAGLQDDLFKGMLADKDQNYGFYDDRKRAPEGGVTIGGKYYKGGEFIPSEEIEKASEDELKKLNGKDPADGKGKDPADGKGKDPADREGIDLSKETDSPEEVENILWPLHVEMLKGEGYSDKEIEILKDKYKEDLLFDAFEGMSGEDIIEDFDPRAAYIMAEEAFEEIELSDAEEEYLSSTIEARIKKGIAESDDFVNFAIDTFLDQNEGYRLEKRSGISNSAYLTDKTGNERVRISDHDLPEHWEKEHGVADREIVISKKNNIGESTNVVVPDRVFGDDLVNNLRKQIKKAR